MDVAVEATTRPLSTLSTFSYIPARRKETKEMSYFNTESKVRTWNSAEEVSLGLLVATLTIPAYYIFNRAFLLPDNLNCLSG